MFFIGLPVEKGGKLYNCAAAICGGKILALIPKSSLPNYGEFYEKRYFTEAENFVDTGFVFGCGKNAYAVPFGRNVLIEDSATGTCVACEICEDLWVSAPPSQNHAAAGAVIIVNLSASDETVGKAEYRPHACEIRFRTQPLRVCVRGCRAGRIGYRLRVCGALSYCGKRRNFKRKRFVFGKRRKRRNRRGIFKKRTPQNDDVQAVCGKLYARFCRFRRRKRSENTGNRTPAVRSRRRGRGREKRIDFIAAIPCAGAAVAACRG